MTTTHPSTASTRIVVTGSPWLAGSVTVFSLSAALSAWVCVASERVLWASFPAAVLVCGLALALGACVLVLASPQERSFDPIVAACAGLFLLQVVLLGSALLLRTDVVASALVGVLLCAAALKATRRSRPLSKLRLEWAGLMSLIVTLVSTSIWSRQNLSGLVIQGESVVSVPWLDTFYHSTFIAHFAHASGPRVFSDPLLDRSVLPVYHYAGYLVPSLMLRLSMSTAYVAAVGVFAPLGLLCASLGAYSFGRLVLGAPAGALAALACLVIPDASFYFVPNRWLSYFFFQGIAANGAFAGGLLALAWALCFKGIVDRNRRCTALALAAGACVVLFKSQIFLAYSFSLLLFAVSFLPRARLRSRLLLALVAIGLFAVSAMVILPALPRAPTFAVDTEGGASNLAAALSLTAQTSGPWVAKMVRHPVQLLLTASVLMPALTLGLLLPSSALLLGSREVRRRLGAHVAAFPAVVLMNFIVVTAALRPNRQYGDAFELIHKTFVWPHLAIALWCGCALSEWISARSPATRSWLFIGALPLACLLGGLWVQRSSGQLMDAYVFEGSQMFANMRYPRGFYESAALLRESTKPEATIQLVTNDSTLAFSAFAERHSYIVYTAAQGVPPQQRERLQHLNRLLRGDSAAQVSRVARELRIDYLVLSPDVQTAWPAELLPIYERDGYRIYSF